MGKEQREQAFDAFVTARWSALVRTAYLITGDRQSAEDLLQTSLAKTLVASRSLGEPESLEAYVRRVMVTTNISWWRRHRDREVVRDDLRDTDHDEPVEMDVRVVERDRLWRALAQLSERQRTVLVLRYYEDLPEEEIARLMGCSRGSVKAHSSRGLHTLRRIVGSADDPGSGSLLDPVRGAS